MLKVLSIIKPSAKVLVIVLCLGFCIFSLIKNADPYFDTSKLPKLQIGDLVLRKGTVLDSSIITHLSKSNVTANFLPPRIFNSKLLQYPKAKVI